MLWTFSNCPKSKWEVFSSTLFSSEGDDHLDEDDGEVGGNDAAASSQSQGGAADSNQASWRQLFLDVASEHLLRVGDPHVDAAQVWRTRTLYH
jgi:hypothetical protein